MRCAWAGESAYRVTSPSNALGLDELANEPHQIDVARWDPDGARVALSTTDLAVVSCFIEADGAVVTRQALPFVSPVEPLFAEAIGHS